MAEMISGVPLFRGRDNNDQLTQILRVLGTPDEVTLRRIQTESILTDFVSAHFIASGSLRFSSDRSLEWLEFLSNHFTLKLIH
ncbi:hypothetical protein PtA15_1A138 [Puccinia triticina]|uniref:Protein kinase domain-containing protein n=1 Tax=Puccinia triticina TaxID=208348 RepID=A0ABY7C6N1_9BASI|nr:uncharacterized protein PtA15_1A138 [Puccinia triticina]WAQ80800.1 hypothetical protein PtA15_1A138 [Puccinia triticina]